MPSGHYVTARIDGGTPNARTAWLCGPFTGPRAATAALRMVGPIAYLANKTSDPRFAFAGFGTAKLSADHLPPGRLDIAALADDNYAGRVILSSRTD